MNAMLAKLMHNRLYMMNVGSSFVAQLFSALYMIVLTPRILGSLGEENFASYGLILSAIAFGAIFDLGMNTSMLRRVIHERGNRNTLFISLLSFYFGVFVLFLILLLSFHHSVNGWFKGLEFIHLLLLLVLIFQNLLLLLLDNLVQSTQKIYVAKFVRSGKIFLEFVCIFYSLRYHSLELILIIMVFFNLAYLVVLLFYARKAVDLHISYRYFDFRTLLGHLKYSIWYFLSTLATVLVFQSQIFLLNYLSGPMLVAQFLLFNRFFDVIRMAVANFTAVLFPSIVLAETEKRHDKVTSLFYNSLFRAMLILVVVTVVLFLGGEALFVWWTRGQVPYDQHVFWLFLLFSLLILVDNVSAVFLSALKLNKIPTLVSLLQGLLVLFFTAFLVPLYGLIGVGWASLSALVLTNLFFNPFYLLKNLRFAKN